MTAILPALAGGLVALGLLGVVVGLRPTAIPPREPTAASRRRSSSVTTYADGSQQVHERRDPRA